MHSVNIKWLFFKPLWALITHFSSKIPTKFIRNWSDCAVKYKEYLCLSDKKTTREVGWGTDLFSAHHWESWCLCQPSTNEQTTWSWVRTTSTKPKALLQHLWSAGKTCGDARGGVTPFSSPRCHHLIFCSLTSMSPESSPCFGCAVQKPELPLGNWAEDWRLLREGKKASPKIDYLAHDIEVNEGYHD